MATSSKAIYFPQKSRRQICWTFEQKVSAANHSFEMVWKFTKLFEVLLLKELNYQFFKLNKSSSLHLKPKKRITCSNIWTKLMLYRKCVWKAIFKIERALFGWHSVPYFFRTFHLILQILKVGCLFSMETVWEKISFLKITTAHI